MESNHLNIKEETDFNETPLISTNTEEKQSSKTNEEFLTKMQLAIKHDEVLNFLLEETQMIDFELEGNGNSILSLIKQLENAKDLKTRENIRKEIKSRALKNEEKYVIIIRKLLELAQKKEFAIGISNDTFIYYNGERWLQQNQAFLISFLGEIAQRAGLGLEAQQSKVKADLLKQFQSDAEIPDFNKKSDEERIPLKNCTLIVKKNGEIEIVDFNMDHNLTYQLPYDYDPEATAPLFQMFLDRVLPDKKLQYILLEFMGYVFVKNMKIEKILLLFGVGRNGKSVINDIIHRVLGRKNVTSFTVTSLCDSKSQTRALIENTLLNYSQEFGSGKLDLDNFKTLTSNQQMEVKKLYKNPYIIENYGRLASNCNTLPRVTENKDAFYRRIIILPFKVQIPEEEIDINLAEKIISTELPGIFNMVIEGMKRLVKQNNFTYSEIVEEELRKYRKESNSVLSFVDDENYIPSKTEKVKISELFQTYTNYCTRNNYQPFSSGKFNDQLRDAGFEINRSTGGYYFINCSKKKIDNEIEEDKNKKDSEIISLFFPNNS